MTSTRFGFLIFPGLEELDLVGPWEMMSVWSKRGKGPGQCLMIAEKEEPVVCAKGMIIQPHTTFAECPPLDFLLVPGGEGTRVAVDDRALVRFVAEQANRCRAVLSVCTGAFILHRAGLLSGKKATTHWGSLERLRRLGDVEVVEDRFVRDGSIWTAAGVSAGIDLSLAFIAGESGNDVAGEVQLSTEYYPADTRYGGSHCLDMAPGYVREQA